MATLEGNELVNVESVTALMSLFGANFYGAFYTGNIYTGYGEGKHTPEYMSSTFDGSSFSLTQTTGGRQVSKFVVTAGEDSLWQISFSGLTETINKNYSYNVTVSSSDRTLKFSPSNIEGTFPVGSTSYVNYSTVLSLYVRIKKGQSVTISNTDGSTADIQGNLKFEATRIC